MNFSFSRKYWNFTLHKCYVKECLETSAKSALCYSYD